MVLALLVTSARLVLMKMMLVDESVRFGLTAQTHVSSILALLSDIFPHHSSLSVQLQFGAQPTAKRSSCQKILAVSTMSVIARRLNATKHQFAIAEKHLLFLEKMLMDAQSTTVSATITSAQL